MSLANRPRDWYDMSYEQQREWENNERRHRRAVEDAEDDARRAREDAASVTRLTAERNRMLCNERDEFAEESARVAEKYDDAKRRVVEATNLLRGLIGLLDLLDLPSLMTLKKNHRYVDAVAWLAQHEGVTHGS